MTLADRQRNAEQFFVVGVGCMVIKHLGPMREQGRSNSRRDIIQRRPERFQDFAADNADAGDKCRGKSEKTLILMSVYVEKTDGHIYNQSGGEVLPDPFLKVNRILASNVIYQSDLLLDSYTGCFEGLQKREINIFLLFSLEKIRH